MQQDQGPHNSGTNAGDGKVARGAENGADKLVRLAAERCKLYHDADRQAVAVIQEGDVIQTLYCHTSDFRRWLTSIHFEAHRRGVGPDAMASAIATLEAIANAKDSQEIAVFQRVGKHADAYVIDTGWEDWSAFVIDPVGWRIVRPSPVRFCRNGNTRPLPNPVPGGDINLLWKHANIAGDNRLLVLAYMIECIRPDTPYPVLELIGEQGTAKSSTQRRLKQLLDPAKAMLRGRPKTPEDIFVAARNTHMVSYENISSLTSDHQDVLCVIATGGSYAGRTLFTNMEESSIEVRRPVVMNGITPFVTRPDLIERSIHIELPVIPAERRREETELESEWQREYPIILGALLDLAVVTLQHLPKVRLERHQRMADFERLGEAMTRGMGLPSDTFVRVYGDAARENVDRVLEAEPDLVALDRFLANSVAGFSWSGTFGELYTAIHGRRASSDQARSLSGKLRRNGAALRQRGIDIQKQGHGRSGTRLKLRLLPDWQDMDEASSQSSPSSPLALRVTGGGEPSDGSGNSDRRMCHPRPCDDSDDGDDPFAMSGRRNESRADLQ